jgi:hypothetical protein
MKYTISSCLFFLVLTLGLQAQNDKNPPGTKPFDREIEFNFLSSYYEQDGDNAAVTGGIGTEQLSNFANVIILNVPLDSTHKVSLYGGADYYSSASTDNIDNNVSSASSSDLRGFGTLSYTKLNLPKGETYTYRLGFSAEFDYLSFSGGFSFTKDWNKANTSLTLSGQAFVDRWQLIYPIELRRSVSLPGADRQSFNGSILFSQVLSQRLQMSLSGEAIYMHGTLSTPFHRVYFADEPGPDIERLPNNRLKIPLSVRMNWFPFDQMVLRSYYRYYWDDWGIHAHTAELEVPVKVTKTFTVSPFYRYHTQTGADYFAPYQEHLISDVFYTSDYDLSALQSQMMGIGFKYYPLYGLARSKPFLKSKRVFMFKYIELRAGYYQRSTGLTGMIGSINLGFGIR